MKKMMHILKALGYSYMLTLIILLIYNLILTYTSISSNSITIVTSFITTISAAFGGFYACKHIKENGLVYGFMVGICYIVLLIILFYLAKENPDCEFVPVWISNMNNVLPKGFILPIPLLCDLYVGEPLKIGTDETKEVFLTRAQSALLSLNVSEKGKS